MFNHIKTLKQKINSPLQVQVLLRRNLTSPGKAVVQLREAFIGVISDSPLKQLFNDDITAQRLFNHSMLKYMLVPYVRNTSQI